MSNSSIWPIDRTLSGATTLDHSGPGSNDNEWVLCIPQRSSITGASLSDCLVSITKTLIGEVGVLSLSRDVVDVFSPLADWAITNLAFKIYYYQSFHHKTKSRSVLGGLTIYVSVLHFFSLVLWFLTPFFSFNLVFLLSKEVIHFLE